eukprot:TRINITY_DN2387_c0_g1_i15.p2 TRINITY_DN2387_c0_g1~~TRINITY_DN2387_c0_g1_i15.p2  ORF type:complete len:276 (+),score=65.29 TRINITY_DN2387_c0_g1_i15:1582-2409(+)
MIASPKMNVINEAEFRNRYLKENLWLMSQSDGVITSSKLLEYVNKRTFRNVEYKEPLINLFILLGLLVGFGFFGYVILTTFKKFFLNRRVWLFGSLVVYVICMGGVVYNIIHNVPFTGVDKHGNTEWFSSGGGYQLGAEGYIMSFSITLGGLLWILFTKLAKTQNQSQSRLYYLVTIVAIWMVITFLETVYKGKGYYNPHFWPQPHYIRGPLMNDQGNSLQRIKLRYWVSHYNSNIAPKPQPCNYLGAFVQYGTFYFIIKKEESKRNIDQSYASS